MGLRDKTQRKFVEFFENMARMYEGAEFEVAYSQIQRDTGSANSTLKRALRTMVEEGVLKIELGRNSRYGRFRYLAYQPTVKTSEPENLAKAIQTHEMMPGDTPETQAHAEGEGHEHDVQAFADLKLDVQELVHLTNHLMRRVRHQEMTIALLQDRIAELEDKLYKK